MADLSFVVEQARNLTKKENMPLSINHYLKNMAKLTDQWNVYNYRESDRQRIYLKDIDCPSVWHDKLKEEIPPGVFYLNDSTGDLGGPGSVGDLTINGLGTKKSRGIAPAGDLMSCLPPAMRADNMMCYIGHEGTYTPAHREMCASLGQNIMVEASGMVDEDGIPSKPGSSIWFMTETKDRHLVSEYWLSTLGHDIEVESHFAQINAWKAAPFTTYIVEQKVGDFLLIPPLAPHQVWNRGTRTMKVAWNRTTVETLEMALDEALPRARMVCRDEQYKNKAIILFSLQHYSGLLKHAEVQRQTVSDHAARLEITLCPKIRQLQKDFRRLFTLYTQVLLSETLSPVAPNEKRGQYLPYDSNVTCSYCRCNIFNRFLTCTSCVVPLENGDEDTYDICMECYAMGRSCRCISKFRWVEQFPWQDLLEKHELWRQQIISFEGGPNESSPQPMHIEKRRLKNKTLAQVCQEQLKIRPWQDPKKEPLGEAEEKDMEQEEDEVNADGSIKKKRKKHRSEKWLTENIACHICKHREVKWKLAACSCGASYCYGSLWRGFDMMPQTVMEDPDWKCPKCLKICTCSQCRKDPQSKPFEPNGTILGHDTKKIADPRSVESLVDFSHSNINWVKKAGDDHPHETRRLQRRRDEAARAKSRDPALDDNYVDEDSAPSSQARSVFGGDDTSRNGVPIDPQLSEEYTSVRPSSVDADHEIDSELSNSPRVALSDRTMKPDVATPFSRGDTSQAEKQRMRNAAAEALKAMGGLSRLEQDPEGFLMAAGIDQRTQQGIQTPTQFVVPAATMIDQEYPATNAAKMAANGIAYEYPDPTSQHIDVPSPQAVNFHSTFSFPRNGPLAGVSQKRKRKGDRLVIQSDVVPSPKNDANAQFQQVQTQRILGEAKRKGRYISAEAAISGKQLLVKLPFSTVQLARINGSDNFSKAAEQMGLSGDTIDDRRETTLLESDLPTKLYSDAQTATRQQLPKKRRIRVETDEDFSTRRLRNRRSSAAQNSIARKPSLIHVEVSEESEIEEDQELLPEEVQVPQPISKERPLPSYLARRSPAENEESPKELPKKARGRPPKKKRPGSRHVSPLIHESTVNGANLLPDLGMSLGRDLDMVIDDLEAEAVTSPFPDTSPSTLIPGVLDPCNNALSNPAEANRKAKMKAMKWAESDSPTDDSESDSGSIIELAAPKNPTVKVRSLGRRGLSSKDDKLTKKTPATVSPIAAKRSIFSKPGAKIRITSVKPGSGVTGSDIRNG